MRLWWDDEHGAAPVVVSTVDELDSALGRAQRIAPAGRVVVQAALDDGSFIDVGLNSGKGAVYFADMPRGWYTMSDAPSNEYSVSYSYMGNERPYPPNSELPIALVRKAAAEFMTTGARPTCVAWQARPPLDPQDDEAF